LAPSTVARWIGCDNGPVIACLTGGKLGALVDAEFPVIACLIRGLWTTGGRGPRCGTLHLLTHLHSGERKALRPRSHRPRGVCDNGRRVWCLRPSAKPCPPSRSRSLRVEAIDHAADHCSLLLISMAHRDRRPPDRVRQFPFPRTIARSCAKLIVVARSKDRPTARRATEPAPTLPSLTSDRRYGNRHRNAPHTVGRGMDKRHNRLSRSQAVATLPTANIARIGHRRQSRWHVEG
jgi:hypothetical protein